MEERNVLGISVPRLFLGFALFLGISASIHPIQPVFGTPDNIPQPSPWNALDFDDSADGRLETIRITIGGDIKDKGLFAPNTPRTEVEITDERCLRRVSSSLTSAVRFAIHRENIENWMWPSLGAPHGTIELCSKKRTVQIVMAYGFALNGRYKDPNSVFFSYTLTHAVQSALLEKIGKGMTDIQLTKLTGEFAIDREKDAWKTFTKK